MNITFKKITMVGFGLMAGSLAASLRKTGFKGKIIGVSRPATLSRAGQLDLIDEGFDYCELDKGVKQSDLIILCTPILRIIELIQELGANAQWLSPGCIITDVGSTKAWISDTARKCIPDSFYFIGGHPMAGSEKSGVAASDPFLYQNSICVLAPQPNVPDERISALSMFWESTGAKVKIMGPHTHDRIAAAVSHLPQMLAVDLVNLLSEYNKEDKNYLSLAAGGFRDMTRIASSGYSMWKDILATNKTEIQNIIRIYMEKLEASIKRLEKDDLGGSFESAAETRLNIPADTKGFISQLHEVLVVVEDKPGVIADISTALSKEDLNIKDIEVLKVREGQGGTLRLAFDSQEIAKQAVEILAKIHVSARLKD
jgi:prephenate dehydrogenase